jgi:predicted dehydrogenase
MTVIRIGIAGAGPWARLFHAPMLAAAPDLELSAIWARRADAARELADEFGAAPVDSFENLLDLCDAVAFTVPPNVQAQLAPNAARAGKHLLLEKPLAFTVSDAEAIAAAVDDAGVASQLVLTYRYLAPIQEFLAAVGASPVRYLRAAWITAGLEGSPFDTPWRSEPRAGLLDIGPHLLDLMDSAGGPIESVYAGEAGGVVAITTRHRGGAIGQAAVPLTTPGVGSPVEAEAITDTGRVILADSTPRDVDALRAAIASDFVRTVRGEVNQPRDVHRGVFLQRVIAAVLRSIDTGREQTP